MINITDFFENHPTLNTFSEIIDSIMNIPDDQLNPVTIEAIQGMVSGALTPTIREQSIQQLLDYYRDNNTPRNAVKTEVVLMRNDIQELISELKPSAEKEALLNSIFELFFDIFDQAEERYLTFDIELPITLEEGAQTPTYAHETDAAADLYARETIVIPAHSFSNKVDTGVHIGLPEGWLAHIAPRSSIGAKTPLRLSNMLGVIDSGYRGPLIVMFDNLSDSDYTINAGDRIAQLWVCPSYRFKANVVDSLDDTDRGEGGLGSTGK